MDFSTILKNEMLKKKVRISDLSRKTGISNSTISSIFDKGVCPSFDNAYKIATALRVPLEYLATGHPVDVALKSQTSLNRQRMREAIETVEEICKILGQSMTPEEKSEKILIIYDIFTESDKTEAENDKRLKDAERAKVKNKRGKDGHMLLQLMQTIKKRSYIVEEK